MLTHLQDVEAKINQAVTQGAMESALQDKRKAKKYERQVQQIAEEYN